MSHLVVIYTLFTHQYYLALRSLLTVRLFSMFYVLLYVPLMFYFLSCLRLLSRHVILFILLLYLWCCSAILSVTMTGYGLDISRIKSRLRTVFSIQVQTSHPLVPSVPVLFAGGSNGWDVALTTSLSPPFWR